MPETVIAARPGGRPVPDPAGGAAAGSPVRPIRPDDLDAATGLWLAEVRWDAQFGPATERPSTTRAIRQQLRDVLSRDQPWTWVAEDAAGGPAGLLVVNPPERAEWIARLTSAAPVGYLSCLVVAAGRRGGGLGGALVRQAHAALDAAGVGVTAHRHYADECVVGLAP
ncbi:MAG: N-acetyltransferase [Micromonosporaceae bacterium]|nr:N-acetyltransferase [Micromonosporaceae bacterium]